VADDWNCWCYSIRHEEVKYVNLVNFLSNNVEDEFEAKIDIVGDRIILKKSLGKIK
jgi:hypothetical protein